MKKRILIIDDDEDLSFVMKDMLENYEYEVECAYSSEEGFEKLGLQTYHLILLDIHLTDATGFEICEQLRRQTTVPVLFASARISEADRITGLEIGGDGYIKKPYSMKELLATVNAIMRRTYGFEQQEEIMHLGCLEINLTARTVKKNGGTVALSLREFDLLAYLLQHKNQAIRKDVILSEVWGAFCEVEPTTLAVHIRWLREKLEQNPAKPEYIKTVWGMGYKLEVPDEA